MAVNKHVGFLEVSSDKFAGIFELGKNQGVRIVLQIDPFVGQNLSFLYFILDLGDRIGVLS